MTCNPSNLEALMTWKQTGKKTIWYVYPTHHVVSFALVAKRHVEQLRKAFIVQEIEEKAFSHISPTTNPTVLVHPLLYIAGSNYERYIFLRGKINKLIGVEVADSDRISEQAVSICNIADAIIVPSTFAQKAYVNSGVAVPVHVVPHGLSKHYYRPKRPPQHREIEFIRRLKKAKNYVMLLFFLWHSSFRKGADLVYRVVTKLQRARPNIVLILKGSGLSIAHGMTFNETKTILISGWLSDDDVVDLYDSADIYLLFSRGGGFEMNGLEALARGLIVLGAERGAWCDYLPQEFRLPVARWVKVFPDNPYHVGYGPEIDIEKAVDRLIEIIDNIDKYKEIARKYSQEVRSQYSWDKIGEKLINIVKEYV